tara:strand:+ start:261 stop:506 length:246 start_codon:yes stop_codon:yes gene_type:complete
MLDMKLMLLTICLTTFALPSWGEDNIDKPWSKKSCNEVYEAIGIFAFLADKEWEQDEEKAARYLLASANYATIYETVCNQK